LDIEIALDEIGDYPLKALNHYSFESLKGEKDFLKLLLLSRG